MAYQTKFDGSTEATIKLGGENNPQSIEGYFLGTKATKSEYGDGKLHIFQTSAGNVGVWGKTRMDSLLTQDLVGLMVLVSFTGMIAPSKKGRKPSYGYKVQFDKDNSINTDHINLSAASSEDEGSDDSEGYESDEAPVAYKAPVAPSRPASTPSTDRQAQLQALLNKRK